MLKRHPKTYRNLVILVALTGAAVFAIYYLYFRPPATTVTHEIVAGKIDADPSTAITPRITYRFTESEKNTIPPFGSKEKNPVSEPPEPIETISQTPVEIPMAETPVDTEVETAFMMPTVMDAPLSAIESADETTASDHVVDSPPAEQSETATTKPGIQYWNPYKDVSEENIPTLLNSDASESIDTLSMDSGQPIETLSPGPAEIQKTNRTVSDSQPPDIPSSANVEKPAPALKEPPPVKQTTPENDTSGPVKTASVKSDESTPPEQFPPLKKTFPETAGAPEKKPEKKNETSNRSIDDKVWVINALSTQDEARHWKVFRSLSKHPYRVYTYTAQVKGKEWRRIRVGFFHTKDEAMAVGHGLSREHDLPEPWIVRPGPEEMEKYYLK